MFSDWLASRRTEQPAPDSRPGQGLESEAVQALAMGVQSLCTLCEQLLDLVSDTAPEAAQSLLRDIPEQLQAVRACAGEMKYRDILEAPEHGDPYSLASLGQWVWRE